jgi:hypothetical protein
MAKQYLINGEVYRQPDPPKPADESKVLDPYLSEEEILARYPTAEPYTPPSSVPAEPTPEEIEANRVAATKAIAYDKIIAIAEEWKQRNIIASSAEVLRQAVKALLVDLGKQDDADALDAQLAQADSVWAAVLQIRSASDSIEATPGEDPKTSTKWPE